MAWDISISENSVKILTECTGQVTIVLVPAIEADFLTEQTRRNADTNRFVGLAFVRIHDTYL